MADSSVQASFLTVRRSPVIYPALMLALNAGMRNAEIRHLRWNQVDLKKQFLTVGRSKTQAGEGRTIPLNAPSSMPCGNTRNGTWRASVA